MHIKSITFSFDVMKNNPAANPMALMKVNLIKY